MIPAVTSVLTTGGQYCLLALAFAFVWWSSRTFFVAGAALIPATGAVLFTLVSPKGAGLVPAGFVAVLFSVALAAVIEASVMRPMADWRRGSGRGGLTESAVLDSAIVSFALYLLLVNALQWAVGTETDSVTLRGQGILAYRHYGIPGTPLQLHANAVGLIQIVVLWTLSIGLLAVLGSRLGLQLRAAKCDLRLFDQITGKGGLVRLVAVLFCGAAAGLIGVLMTCTSRVDLGGGLTTALGAMAVMIAGTQSRRLILIPVLSLMLAAADHLLQSHGLSIWVRPLAVSLLLAILLLNPGGLVSEVRRAEEEAEA
jgi:branched-subunit amino acid ABC-type transport system permease component